MIAKLYRKKFQFLIQINFKNQVISINSKIYLMIIKNMHLKHQTFSKHKKIIRI